MLRRLAASAASAFVLAGALLGCGGSASGDGEPASCSADPAELRAAFRPLPDGLDYGELPSAQLEEVRKELGSAYKALDARIVTRRGTPVATVLVQVVREPVDDEDRYLRGVASGFGAEGAGRELSLNGRDVTRIEREGLAAYVSLYGSCRALYVVGPPGAETERVAGAVLR